MQLGVLAQNSREDLQKREQELQKELVELNRLYSETQSNKKLSLKQLAIIKSKINLCFRRGNKTLCEQIHRRTTIVPHPINNRSYSLFLKLFNWSNSGISFILA